MSAKANPTLVGTFVLAAMGLAVAGVVVFGSGRLLSEMVPIVMYFEGDVGGLQVGAPVQFRGVKLGTVSDIKLLADPGELVFRTRVQAEMDPGRMTKMYFTDPAKEAKQVLPEAERAQIFKALVDRGLRAQLQSQSFVTGLLDVELDLHPGTPVVLAGIDKDMLELPTIPSSLEQVQRKLENLPVDELFAKLVVTVEGIRRLVDSPELASSLRSLDEALKSMDALARSATTLASNADSRLGTLSAQVDGGVKDARTLIKSANESITPLRSSLARAAASVEGGAAAMEALMLSMKETTSDRSPMYIEVTKAAKEMAAAARALRLLADTLDTRPDLLVRGRRDAGDQR